MAVLLSLVAAGTLWGTRQGNPSTPVEQGDQDQTTADPSSTTSRPPTTTSDETAATAASQNTTTAETQLLDNDFEGPFGYDLLITTTGRPARLDLDTGTVIYAQGSRVSPQFAFDSWVVVESGIDGSVGKLPLDNLGADLQPFVETDSIAAYSYLPSPLRAVESGELWIVVTRDLNSDQPTETLYLVDMETGDILDERIADAEAWKVANSTRAELFTGPAGGVYQATGATYRRVTDGRVITSDDQRALIQTCDDVLVCTLEWLDRRTWEPMDLVVPSNQDALYVVIPGTDWLSSILYSQGSISSAELLNVVTGDRIEDYDPESSYLNPSLLPPVSPDGRWLVTRTDEIRQIGLRNLVSGETVFIELDEAVAGPIFFVEDSSLSLAEDAATRLTTCMRGNGGVEATDVRFTLDGQLVNDVELSYTGKGSPLYDDVYKSCLRHVTKELDLKID